jgi:hypothetical protein
MAPAGSAKMIRRPAATTIQIALLVLGACALAAAVWDVAMGGFFFTVGGLRVSSREAYKPFRLAMLAIAAAIWLHDRTAEPADTTWKRLPKWTVPVAAAASLMSMLVAIRFGIFAAGGSDAYGYVSQAFLWASGRLVTPDPLAALEPALGQAVAPIGYRLATTPGAIVPIYPAGFPMTMAVALKIGGATAIYYVVPVLGALAVFLTYLLGARIDRPVTGMIAAILVAFSTIFMFQTFEPMSDVPVTAWFLLAWVVGLSSKDSAAFASGLAVSAAVLTRPNLVPLAIVVAAVVASHAPRARRFALFAAGAVPGCLVVAAINWRLYGSPLAPGYGPLESLYAWSYVKTNLRTYLGWLWQLSSPFVLLALVAPIVARRRHQVAMLVFFVVLLGCYVWYIPFAPWPFLRFLLPGIPLLLILSSTVFVRAVDLLPLSLRTVAVLILCTLLPIRYVIKSDSLRMFATHRSEHRYIAIGNYLRRTLPPDVVVMSMIQSGSLRLYGDRLTVRWDMLPANKLDAAVQALQAAGYRPYLLLEDWELPLFRDLFGGANQYGRIDWPPAFEYRDISKVWIYEFADRGRYFSGVNVTPRPVPIDE